MKVLLAANLFIVVLWSSVVYADDFWGGFERGFYQGMQNSQRQREQQQYYEQQRQQQDQQYEYQQKLQQKQVGRYQFQNTPGGLYRLDTITGNIEKVTPDEPPIMAPADIYKVAKKCPGCGQWIKSAKFSYGRDRCPHCGSPTKDQ